MCDFEFSCNNQTIGCKIAFEMVNRQLLCKKKGISCYPWNGMWVVKNCSRKQCVSIDECKSDVCIISCGVPQSSILGLKPFIQ